METIENKGISKITNLSKRRIIVKKGDFIIKQGSLKEKKGDKRGDILTEMKGKVVENK